MPANEAVVITVREDGALVVKRNLDAMGAAGTKASKGIDRVKLALGSMTTSIAGVSPAMSSMQAKIGIITGSLGNFIKSARDSASAFVGFQRASDDVDQLRASLDPAFAALQKFDKALELLNSSLVSGAISNSQYEATLELVMREYETTSSGALKLAAAQATLQTQLDSLRAGYDPLFASSKRYEAAVDTLNAGLREGMVSISQYEAALERLGQQYLTTGAQSKSLGVAAANSANVFAQFNDIGVMMAAGQNPIQLALQQGTQLSQVFTGIVASGGGVRGVLSALASGFMSLISPISLITIGVIAFGAAAVQWFTAGSEKAMTMKDRLDELSSAVSAYTSMAGIASSSTTELSEKFGLAGEKIGKMSQTLSEFLQVQAITKMQEALGQLSEEFGGFAGQVLTPRAGGNVMTELERTTMTVRDEFGLLNSQAVSLVGALQQMQTAQNPQEAIAASQLFNDILLQIYGTAELVPVQFQNMAIAAGEVARMGGEVLSAEEKILAARQANYVLQQQIYAASRVKANEDLATANALVKSYQEQTRMQQLIAQYGESSVQVTKARQAAELQVLQAQVDQLDVSQAVKDEIMRAAQATNGAINATNAWASAMAGVAAQIRGIMAALSALSGTLIGNASAQVEVQALKAGKTIAEARIAATKYEIETEYKARDMGAKNVFERGLVWMDKTAKLKAVDLATELTGLQKIAAEKERAASAGGGGGGGGGGGKPKLSDEMKLENDLLEDAIGKRGEFVEKLNAVNALLAEGSAAYTKTDAFTELAGMVGSDIFAGTQEAIDAQIARFQVMYDQIEMMRQADLISEQSARQAMAAVEVQYTEMRLSGQKALFGELAKLSKSGNRTLAAIGKAAAVAQATIDGYLAIQKALAEYPPPMSYAIAGAVGLTTAANVASILSTNANFATGGSFVVPGSGGVDSAMVGLRASPGERVTVQTPAQVRKGTEAANGTSGGATGAAPQVNQRIINVIDPAIVGDYLATPEGEDVLVNVISRSGIMGRSGA